MLRISDGEITLQFSVGGDFDNERTVSYRT